MITVDYTYYKDEFHGKLSEDDFNRLVNLGYVTIDNFTFGRFQNLTESDLNEFTIMKVKSCICAVCDRLESDSIGVGLKSSESVGSWSVNYASDTLPKSVMSSLHSVVNFYLGGTPLTCSWI